MNLLTKTKALHWANSIAVMNRITSWRDWQIILKRGLDLFVSVILLLLLLPLMGVVALLIKLSSPGPVLFIQSRVGYGERKFRMYKFRTMIEGAEEKIMYLQHLNEASGPVFKITEDPRVTAIGRFLRKSSIDELPQLLNVLKGDMSLVGPRPLSSRDYETFRPNWAHSRFSVRPGISCLWQINGRSLIPFEKWMELDQQYVRQWSLWLDLKVLTRTIPAVLKGTGAV